ncbi:MAG: serine/threonine protein kinase, partial [Planctomycetes bacterium]|nr:serine/threonine protein kinase [Planctomycetota bacterium]
MPDKKKSSHSTSEQIGKINDQFISADTVDIQPDQTSARLFTSERVTEFMGHLDDACPVITYEEEDAEEIKARYIIGDEIGSGSIGQVIEAYDEHLARNVAIKILHGDTGVSKDKLARFIAEAQITAQLEHPTIIPVYEIGRMPDGMPYFSMKKVKGESLEDIINNLRIGDEDYRKRYGGKHMIRMFFRLCQGIAYAHSKGVVHRDLKPANILIGEFGVVQIMDWGLAKVMGKNEIRGVNSDGVQTVRSAPELSTLDGSIAGTPAYMSPEQARG